LIEGLVVRLASSERERGRKTSGRVDDVPRAAMNPLVLILIIILVLAVFGGLPSVGLLHLGFFPSGIAGLILLILIILLLMGRL